MSQQMTAAQKRKTGKLTIRIRLTPETKRLCMLPPFVEPPVKKKRKSHPHRSPDQVEKDVDNYFEAKAEDPDLTLQQFAATLGITKGQMSKDLNNPVLNRRLRPAPVVNVKGVWKSVQPLGPRGIYTYPVCGHKEKFTALQYFLDHFRTRYTPDQLIYSCITCRFKKEQQFKQTRADLTLDATMHENEGKHQLNWPQEKKHFKLDQHLKKCFKGKNMQKLAMDLNKDAEWKMWVTAPIECKVLDLPDVPVTTNTQRDTIRGGFLAPGATFGKQQMLASPFDNSNGIVMWPNGPTKIKDRPTKDYAIFAKRGTFSDSNILNMGKSEMEHIAKGLRDKRPCGASGFTMAGKEPSNSDPISLTPATRGEFGRALYPTEEHLTSTNLNVVYFDKNEKLTDWGGIYADVKQRRLDKSSKRKEAKKYQIYRKALKEEMKSRMQAFAIILGLGLDTFPRLFGTFQEAMDRVQIKSCQMEWHEVDPTLTLFEILLLEYACGTGEMRNHQALAAHVDANKSHPLESMILYDRFGSDKPGSLMIPQKGIGIVMEPGTLVHLQLGNTMHVPDSSRNEQNWTKVHGP